MKSFILYSSLMLLVPVMASARPGGEGRGPHFKRLIEQLDLSDEQRSKINEIKESNRPEMKAAHEELDTQRDAFHELMKTAATDDALRTAFTKMEEIKGKLALLRFNSMLKIRQVLTAEQRVKFEELKGKRGPRGHHRGPKPGEFDGE